MRLSVVAVPRLHDGGEANGAGFRGSGRPLGLEGLGLVHVEAAEDGGLSVLGTEQRVHQLVEGDQVS